MGNSPKLSKTRQFEYEVSADEFDELFEHPRKSEEPIIWNGFEVFEYYSFSPPQGDRKFFLYLRVPEGMEPFSRAVGGIEVPDVDDPDFGHLPDVLLPDCEDVNAPVWNCRKTDVSDEHSVGSEEVFRGSAYREVTGTRSTALHVQQVGRSLRRRAKPRWRVRAAHAAQDAWFEASGFVAFVVKSALGALLAWIIILAGMSYL